MNGSKSFSSEKISNLRLSNIIFTLRRFSIGQLLEIGGSEDLVKARDRIAWVRFHFTSIEAGVGTNSKRVSCLGAAYKCSKAGVLATMESFCINISLVTSLMVILC